MAKAFDRVNHKILLAKLYYHSIHGVNAHWTESCPVSRKQKVDIILQNQQKNLFFFYMGNNIMWCSPGMNSGTFFVHAIY